MYGVLDDVLLKVDIGFLFPADFVILDMPEDEDADTPLILVRSFLAVYIARIDVELEEFIL